jgi:tRNA (guanine-N7-)-methyltransferase
VSTEDFPERNFYGRRKGKPLDGRKARLMEEALPRLLLDPTADPVTDLRPLFEARVERVEMEIGFGGGEHLANRARDNPNIGFIGVEPFIDGMAKMMGQIEDHGLTNLRLYNDDAAFLLDWLPEASLARLDLLYPDPWPKIRHWKRRFVNQANLTRIHRVLTADATFRFASDIDTYVNWTLGHVHKSGLFRWAATRAADWNEPWEGWLRTRYEAKAVREGRTPCYLIFAPKKD